MLVLYKALILGAEHWSFSIHPQMTPKIFFSGFEASISSFALHLPAFIYFQLPGVHEEIDLPAKMISYNYGPGYKNVICVCIPSKKGVKLCCRKRSMLIKNDLHR